MEKIRQAAQWIKESDNIVFFGGAGTSTKSGIPDFRSEDGLYSRDDIPGEVALSRGYMEEHPDAFSHRYKNQLIFPDARPNVLHEVLVEWEKRGKLRAVITQNIDNMHQKAGSVNVIELHGNLSDHICVRCGEEYDLDYALQFEHSAVCEACGGFVRPQVTLFGEMLPEGAFERAVEAVQKADVMIVAGTSLVVYPAAGLLQYYEGDRLILMNRDATPMDSRANLIFREDIGEVLDKINRESQ